GVAEDITERKRVEMALQKNEHLLSETQVLGRTGSWEHNLVTGEIANTEGNLHLFFGDDHSKGARFEDFADVVHPDDREYVSARPARPCWPEPDRPENQHRSPPASARFTGKRRSSCTSR